MVTLKLKYSYIILNFKITHFATVVRITSYLIQHLCNFSTLFLFNCLEQMWKKEHDQVQWMANLSFGWTAADLKNWRVGNYMQLAILNKGLRVGGGGLNGLLP